MQKQFKQNLLIYLIGFSILGFIIGESIGQELEKHTPQIQSHNAFGLIDTTVHPPLMGSIPPNYWHTSKNPTPTTTTYVIPDKQKVTGIVLSNTCIAAIKANNTTDCPRYQDIQYADTSNKMFSGYFGYDKNGFYERLPNNFKQNLAYYYTLNHPSVIVDPPKDIIDKVPLITIYPSLNQFADKYQDLDGTYATTTSTTSGYLTLHQFRVVEDCAGVTDITFTKEILNDTIHYVQSGCKVTNLTTEIKNPIKLNYTDPTTTALYKYQQALNLEKKTTAIHDCRYIKCDVSVSGKKW